MSLLDKLQQYWDNLGISHKAIVAVLSITTFPIAALYAYLAVNEHTVKKGG